MENTDKKIDELIGVVKDLATKVNENTSAIEDLAVMTKNGFDAVDHRFDVVEKDISELKKDVGILKIDVSDIKLALDDHPHRYEFDALDTRVKTLEVKAK